MEKVMLLSVECCEDAVFVTDACSSVYHSTGSFSSQLHMPLEIWLENMDRQYGSVSHTRASAEQHSFCAIEKSYFSFCRALSNAV